jgi:hypothetical protein
MPLLLREALLTPNSSKRMFTKRFREWSVVKNIGSHDVLEYLQRANRATRTTLDSTPSVTLRGRTVTKQRLSNHMRRSRITPEALLNEAETPGKDPLKFDSGFGTRTSSPSPKKRLKSTVDVLTDMGIKPYMDFETSLDNVEMQDRLSSEELTSLQIAMLQTDFHYRRIDEDTLPTIYGGVEKQVHDPVTTLSPPQSLAGPQELRDLEFVLHSSNIAYGQFPQSKYSPSSEQFQLSARQQGQAKDFYARHWLAINLISKQFHHKEKSFRVGFDLLGQTNAQVREILEENHPHFLPWFAFVVCYPGEFCRSRDIQRDTLNFTLAVSGTILSNKDPRMQIQLCLATSKFRKSICLAMLQQVISFFRREIQQSHLEALSLLARLFDNIEAHDHFDGDVVEETLQRWAQSSLSIAAVIEEDQKLARRRGE